MTDEEMDRRLDEQPELIDRLRAGHSSALDDLLGACTGAKISTVEVRFLKIPEFVGAWRWRQRPPAVVGAVLAGNPDAPYPGGMRSVTR